MMWAVIIAGVWLAGFSAWFMWRKEPSAVEVDTQFGDLPASGWAGWTAEDDEFVESSQWTPAQMAQMAARTEQPQPAEMAVANPLYLSPEEWFEDRARRGEGQ